MAVTRASTANRAGSGAAVSCGSGRAGCLLTAVLSPVTELLLAAGTRVLLRCSMVTEHKAIAVAAGSNHAAGNHSEEGGVNGCTIFS